MSLPGNPSSLADYAIAPTGVANYLVGPVDPTTDWDAAGANKMISDAAQMTQTAIRAIVAMTLNGTSAPVLVSHAAMWGNAPGVAPTLAYGGSTGVYTATWAANQVDAFGNAIALNFRYALHPTVTDAAFGGIVRAARTAPNVVTLYSFNSSGAATTLTGVNIVVAVI